MRTARGDGRAPRRSAGRSRESRPQSRAGVYEPKAPNRHGGLAGRTYAITATCWDFHTRAPNARSMDSSAALVGAARERHAKPLAARERFASMVVGTAFLIAAATTLVLVPW